MISSTKILNKQLCIEFNKLQCDITELWTFTSLHEVIYLNAIFANGEKIFFKVKS